MTMKMKRIRKMKMRIMHRQKVSYLAMVRKMEVVMSLAVMMRIGKLKKNRMNQKA
ncbi:unnamed protein product [Schistosoma mattheei]|uniref:Uncharacterized protein n=1 Tax=Schistosoma mattheei TaxID=31246 RepID=A0A183NMC3_9TREM|nr:unnamed protein product [Schistosoma mattheei]